MTAWTSLLTFQDIDLETLAVYVALMQSAAPSGALREGHDTIRKMYYRLYGKQIREDAYEEALDTLIEKGAMPSREALYPLSPPQKSKKRVENIVEKLEQDISGVHPDFESYDFPEQERIFSALKVAKALEVAVKEKRKQLSTDQGAVVDAGHQVRYWAKTWDYGFIGKLKGTYGAETVIGTVLDIYRHDGFEKLRQGDWKKRRRVYRKYLIAALKGEVDPASDANQRTAVY